MPLCNTTRSNLRVRMQYLPLAEEMTGLFLRLHESLARGSLTSVEQDLLAKAATGWPVEHVCETLLPSCMRAVRKIDGGGNRFARNQGRWSDAPAIPFADSLAIVEDDILLPLLNDLERRVVAEPKRYRKLAKSLTTEVVNQMVSVADGVLCVRSEVGVEVAHFGCDCYRYLFLFEVQLCVRVFFEAPFIAPFPTLGVI